MKENEINFIKKEANLSDEYVTFLQQHDFRVASKEEISDFVKTHYFPDGFVNYLWVITDREIILENSLDVQLPMICTSDIKTQKNIYTHYHSCLIVLGDVEANIIFTDGETHLMGTTRFNALIADNGGGPEFYVKDPIGKLAWMYPDSCLLDSTDKIDVLYYYVSGDFKGKLSNVLKSEYINYVEELDNDELDSEKIKEDSEKGINVFTY